MITKENPIPRFYSVDFVAKQFDITTKSIYRWIDDGALHFHKFHGVLRISEEDLLNFISTRRK
jgi:excisionase family DNA binding protein